MKTKTLEQLIIDFKGVHGDRYDYSSVKYINMNTKVDIICKTHGIFKQLPSSHFIRKNNCPKCGKQKTSESTLKTLEQLIIDFKGVHGDRYDYSSVKYINMNTKVDIICKTHGIFKQLPLNHLHSKSGCPKCKTSHGESLVRKILEKNNILYLEQKRFKNCRNIRMLPFDFYLPNHNICIEYDGIQHTQCSDFFGGVESFKKIIKNDTIKNRFCYDNNITLIRINHFGKVKIYQNTKELHVDCKSD